MTRHLDAEAIMRQRPSGWWETLCEIIPELIPLTATPQPREHHAEGDVATHTRLTVEACPEDCDPDLLWAALLHDVAKPETTAISEEGRVTAHGHARAGATMAEKILVGLELPEERIRRITWVIRHHLFHHSWQLKSAEDLSRKQTRHLQNPDFPLLLELLRIDSIASHGREDRLASYRFYNELWKAIKGGSQ